MRRLKLSRKPVVGIAGARQSRAAAAVELAVVMPLLLLMLFGIIEFGWTFMIYQSVTNAAREGCRVAVLEGSTDSEITNRIDEYLSGVGLSSGEYSVSIQHASLGDPTETVTVTVPYSSIAMLGEYFNRTHINLISTSRMRKEGAD